MAEFTYPTDAADAGEAEWSAMARRWWGMYGIFGAPGSSAGAVTADTSGGAIRQLLVQPFDGQVLGFGYKLDAVKTLNCAANATGSNRTDRVVLRLSTSGNSLTTAILQGATGGAVPALNVTDTGYEMPLARINVPSGATGFTPANILADERPWMGRRTWTIATATSALPPDVQNGDVVWIADRKRLLVYSGGLLVAQNAPVAYTSDAAGINSVSLGATDHTETTAVTLVVPASPGSQGNRYLITSGKVFMQISDPNAVAIIRMTVAGAEVDAAEVLDGNGGTVTMFHNGPIGPAAVALHLTVQRATGGAGTVAWSAFPSFSNIKATLIPTD